MAAFIKKLFKNRKSDNAQPQPDVSALNPDKPDELNALIELARSAETNSQRGVAIDRIPHIKHLIPLYSEASATVRNRLAGRISALASQHPEQVEQARAALSDPQQQALVHQLCQSADMDAEQISAETDPQKLLSLATEGKTAAVRLAAAERIEGEDELMAVQRAAKGRDKGVYQLTKKRLQLLRQEKDREQAVQNAIEDLIRQAEEHAKTDNLQLYAARVESLQSQWKNLSSAASNDQHTAFLTALDACNRRVREVEEASAREAESHHKQEERKATLDLLRDTLNGLREAMPERGPSLSSLDALQKTQENRWMEATRDSEVAKSEQKDYQALMLELRHYIGSVQRLQQQQEALQSLVDAESPDSAELRQLLETIDWPGGYAQPPALETAARKLGQAREVRKTQTSDQKTQVKALDDLLEKLEKALEQDQYSESRHLHKQAQHAFNALDHKHASQRQARLTLLGRQLQDLQDWRGFATRPKQEELCEAMEYLATQHMEPEAKATHIKELQQEWRDLGGSSDQSLWQRFKKASDIAYEPCHEYFAAKSELKHVNIDKRQAICDQLADFVDNADWQNADWKAVERIHRVARQEWREAWPVDFKANRPLQKRFDHLLKQVEAPLNEERQKNEASKQAIVERAQALIEHEPLGDAMEQAKALQKEWQGIGITRHREDRKLWQDFRAACDAIFARRDAQRAEQAAEDTVALDTLKQAIEDSRQQREAAQDDLATLRQLQQALRSAPAPRRIPAPVSDELATEKSALDQAIQQLERGQQVADWEARLHAGNSQPGDSSNLPDPLPSPREIAIRLEIATGLPSPEEDQELRMKQQVERLAAGLTGGNGSAGSAEDEINRLIDCWCAQSIEPSDAESLMPRLRNALANWQG
ncbi:DUF349 domain-containing protein [Marinobacter mangrovi]|uniref:DUF349 domain-containing protein n=1 Tax=Marinobacter mangrovi TaxID=2803918 RepID=UPI001933BD3E|nr:DUF349 domain-containing protein [Marinobacter mangrovi]